MEKFGPPPSKPSKHPPEDKKPKIEVRPNRETIHKKAPPPAPPEEVDMEGPE